MYFEEWGFGTAPSSRYSNNTWLFHDVNYKKRVLPKGSTLVPLTFTRQPPYQRSFVLDIEQKPLYNQEQTMPTRLLSNYRARKLCCLTVDWRFPKLLDENAILTAPPDTAVLETAFLIRETEQALLELFSQGKLYGTVHTCIGQEFTGVAVAKALRQGDFIVSNHRGHGHYIAWTDDVEGLIAEIMGREAGVCGGRGGSQHLCKDGFYSNGIQGGIVPLATGMALAEKHKATNAVGCVFIGDGTLGEGAVYESLNIASKLQTPLLVLIENNRYSQSTSQHETLSGTFEGRADAFGIRHSRWSTWDWEQLLDGVQAAVDRIRDGLGPEICIVDTYRLMAHSKGDDDRNPVEVQEYKDRDPLNQLIASGEPWVHKIVQKAKDRVAAAVSAADLAPMPKSLGLTNEAHATDISWAERVDEGEGQRLVERLRGALRSAMVDDETIVVLGEDIRSPYGGAFKATKGLSDEFPHRVLNSPISEQALVGIGCGLALRGLRPFVEIMFGDFITLGFDQFLNHAAKFRYMFNDKVRVPMVVRTPMGGYRGYGPTHSQSLEKHFLGIPDTQVLAINSRIPVADFYEKLCNVDSPTLVCEYKVLYTKKPPKPIQGFMIEHTAEAFPCLRIRPRGNVRPELTLVGYGFTVDVLEEALELLFDNHEIVAEIIAPTRLYPLDLRPILASVKQTRQLVIVEEGQVFNGFGSEVMAQLQPQLTGIEWKCARVGAAPVPIPASRGLEAIALPDCKRVIEAALGVVNR